MLLSRSTQLLRCLSLDTRQHRPAIRIQNRRSSTIMASETIAAQANAPLADSDGPTIFDKIISKQVSRSRMHAGLQVGLCHCMSA